MESDSHKQHAVSFERANIIGLIVLLAVVLIMPAIYFIIWNEWMFGAFIDFIDHSWLEILGVSLLSIVVHEGLHGAGFMLGGVPARDVQFGVKWRLLTPFAATRSAMPAAAYRVAVVLPGIVMGVLPAAVGIAIKSGELTWYGTIMIAAAGGDMAALWAAREIPAEVMVQDLPNLVGCRIVE